MSPGIKVIFAVLTGLAASALARLSYGPSPVDTYTSGFIYWLNYYSGFYFGVPVAAIVWLVGTPRTATEWRPTVCFWLPV